MKLGTFHLTGSYVIAPPFAFAHSLPMFLYFTIAGRINLMIRFVDKKHGYRGKFVILNGRYVL